MPIKTNELNRKRRKRFKEEDMENKLREQKIMGGSDVDPGKLPWAVAIYMKNSNY